MDNVIPSIMTFQLILILVMIALASAGFNGHRRQQHDEHHSGGTHVFRSASVIHSVHHHHDNHDKNYRRNWCKNEKYYSPDPHDCSRFIQTADGGAHYSMACPYGTHWSQVKCTCVHGDCKHPNKVIRGHNYLGHHEEHHTGHSAQHHSGHNAEHHVGHNQEHHVGHNQEHHSGHMEEHHTVHKEHHQYVEKLHHVLAHKGHTAYHVNEHKGVHGIGPIRHDRLDLGMDKK